MEHYTWLDIYVVMNHSKGGVTAKALMLLKTCLIMYTLVKILFKHYSNIYTKLFIIVSVSTVLLYKCIYNVFIADR